MALRRILLRLINLALLVVLLFIGFAVAFQLLGANPANDVVAFVREVAGRLLAPFQNMFERQNLVLTALIAVLAYSLVAAVASAIVRLIPAQRAQPRTDPLPEYTPQRMPPRDKPRRRWVPKRSARAEDSSSP